jgi:riboflavin biosynthesis pyrimidine reductase
VSDDQPIPPLELLYEAEGLAVADLPAPLQELYGGGFALPEPRLYANFVATIDGVVAVPSLPRSNELVADGSRGDHLVMGLLRAAADCVLVGAGTLAASPKGTWRAESVFPPTADAFAALRTERGRPPTPEVAILTGNGTLDPSHPVLAARAVVLTSSVGAEALEGRLPSTAEVVVLGEDPHIEPRRALDALRERGHALILSEAGPHTFGGLVAARLVDELFLTVSPLLLGNLGDSGRFGLVEGANLLPAGTKTRLLSVRRHQEHLFLRYEIART